MPPRAKSMVIGWVIPLPVQSTVRSGDTRNHCLFHLHKPLNQFPRNPRNDPLSPVVMEREQRETSSGRPADITILFDQKGVRAVSGGRYSPHDACGTFACNDDISLLKCLDCHNSS